MQLSHHVPTIGGEVSRVRTGYERVIAQRTSAPFASVAKNNGTIEKIDKTNGFIKVVYEDGKREVVPFGTEFTDSSGVVITQDISTTFIEGEPFKKGDVITFNKEFFKADPYSKQVDWKHGVHANVVIMESDKTLEDSNAISVRLSDKLKIKPAHVRTITLTAQSVVHQMVDIGQHVQNTDYLMVFEEEDMGSIYSIDPENADMMDMLTKLNRATPKAQNPGVIAKIDIFYSCDPMDLSDSLKRIIQKYTKQKNRRALEAEGTLSEYNFVKSTRIAPGTKFKKVQFEKNTVVVQFYIQEELDAGPGDKLVYDSSLKSIVSDILPEPIKSESGVEIDAIFSGTSINKRIILSPLIVGCVNRILEKMEKDVLDMYFKE